MNDNQKQLLEESVIPVVTLVAVVGTVSVISYRLGYKSGMVSPQAEAAKEVLRKLASLG